MSRFNIRDVIMYDANLAYEDHQWLVELHNDPEVLKNLTNPNPVTPEDHMNWWRGIVASATEERMIFTVDGERVGFCKFYSIDKTNKNCVLGADIHKDHRGNGYAKEMWKLMVDRCFNVHDLHRVSLTTAEYNNKAVHIYTKLGFQEEGRMVESLLREGKYYDQICMRLLREEWQSL